MRSDIVMIKRQADPLRRRQLLCGRHAGPPLRRRPDWARGEAAAAVRAYVVELVLGAVGAERALITANARFRRVRRKVLVAIFAVRPQLQRHVWLAWFEKWRMT